MSAPGPRRIRVLLNPHSGSKGGVPTNDAAAADVRAAMAGAGLGDELIATETEADAIRLTEEAVAQGYDVVVAAGGDGTVGTVARVLVGRPTALGILPLGSVMNIARMLGIPRELDAAAEIIVRAPVRTIDVGSANGRIFFEGGSVGLNAAVFRESQRADTGHYQALAAALWTLIRYRPPRMVIRLDDRVMTTRALAVTVANGPYTGLGYTVAPNAELDDGRFDVCVFSRFSRTELIRHFGAIAFGRLRLSPKMRTYRSARVEIDGVHPLPCRADAADLGVTPVTYRVLPNALNVVAPPKSAAETPAPTLQVIGVGFGRTGTLSLKQALEQLGFGPCEHMTNVMSHRERVRMWADALDRKRRGDPIPWQEIFAGYRATVDWPGATFWRELVAAYPEAKVILTVRDPERWYESADQTIYRLRHWLDRSPAMAAGISIAARFIPVLRDFLQVYNGIVWEEPFGHPARFRDRAHAIRVFNEHNEAVQAAIAPERLLVYQVRDGWQPLCDFLGVPIPAGTPFPHAHDRAQFLEGLQRVEQGFRLATVVAAAASLAAAAWFVRRRR